MSDSDGSTPQGWLARGRGFLRHHWGYLVLAAAVLLPLLWLGRDGTGYILGQDGQTLVQPFAINHDPLVPFSYDFSQSYPIPFYVTGFYAASAVLVLNGITGSSVTAERVLLFGLAALGALGVWDLLGVVGSRWFGPTAGGPVRRGLAVAFYLVNPFALSVVWWHIEGWTENYVFLPWLLTLLLLIYWDGRISLLRGSVVLLLGLLLADGVAGAFAVTIGYLFLLVILGLLLQAVWKRELRRRLPRALATLGLLGVALLAWTSIPFFLTSNPGYSSNTYVNPGNLDAMFVSQSQYTTPWNTIRMVGLSWLYNAPNAYPWGTALIALEIAGTVAAIAYLTSVVWIRRYPGFGLLWIGSAILLALSFGANPPFGALDHRLLDLHGPFLLLVDPYYLILEPWVITVVVAVFVWLASPPEAVLDELRRFARWLARPWGSSTEAAGPAPPPSRRRAVVSAAASWAVLVLGIALVATAIAPVALHGEYASSGPNIDMFPLPLGLPALTAYFSHGYAGSQYRVLAVPLSNSAGVPWSVGGGSFLETSGLLSAYVPYPVLQANDGLLPSALMDWFASTSSTNYTELLEALHIHYVIVTPYVSPRSSETATSPDGHPVNWSHVESTLNASLGRPQNVSGFPVYDVPGASPYLWVESNLTTVVEPSFAGYLDLLGRLSSTDPISTYLDSALWSPNASASTDALQLSPVDSASSVVALAPGASARVVFQNGTSAPVPGAAASAVGVTARPVGSSGARQVVVQQPILDALNDSNSYKTNLASSSGELSAPRGSNVSFGYKGSVSGPLTIATNWTLELNPGNNWAQLQIVSANQTLQAQLFDAAPSPSGSLGLSVQNSQGTAFAWSDTAVPFPTGSPTFQLTLEVAAGAFGAQLAAGNGTILASVSVVFGTAANVTSDPGHNLAAMPAPASGNLPSKVGLSTVFAGLSLPELTVYRTTSLADVATFSGANRSTAAPASISQGATGAWTISPNASSSNASVGHPYVVLDLPQFPAWNVAGPGGTGTAVTVSNQSNAFQMPAPLSAGATVRVAFSSPQLAGLAASWVEAGAAGAVCLVAVYRRFRR